MKIRTVSYDDCEQMTELTRDLGYPSSSEKMCEILDRVINHPDHFIFVADVDDKIYGYIHMVASILNESDVILDIAALLVSEKYRGHGVGAAFIQEAEKLSGQKNARLLRIRSNLIRPDAYAFFEHRGFVNLKSQEIFIREF